MRISIKYTFQKAEELYHARLAPFFKGNKFKICIIIFSSFLFSMYLFGSNLHSKWWMIDDHEIMVFLGEDGHLPLKEIPKVLIEKTEVGKYGVSERYRPSYYTLRLLETAVWGNNPMLWYLSRITILTFFLSVVWYIVWKQFDLLKGMIVVILVLSANYWAELISRLGPAETYASLGVAMFFLGLYKLFRYITNADLNIKARTWGYQILMVLGAIIAIGSKENFIILLVPTLLLLIFAFFRKKLDWSLIITTLLIVVFGGFVISSVLMGISATGSDIYGDHINIKELVALIYHEIPIVLEIFKMKILTIGLIGTSLFIFFLKKKTSIKKYLKSITIFYFAMLVLIGLYLFQIFFYRGAWPTGTRYDFPGLLYIPFFFLNIIYIIQETFNSFGIKKIVQEKIFSAMFVFAIFFISPKEHFDFLRTYTQENVTRTTTFTNTIDSIVKASNQNPNAPIFFESYSFWDYEVISSVYRFLKVNGVQNDMYVNAHNIIGTSEFEQKLANGINTVSEKGGYFGDAYLEDAYFREKAGDLKKEKGCISLFISGYEEDPCNSFIIR